MKGNIEQVDQTSISGWLYGESSDLRDMTVLAFVDHVCVGSGRIGLFRQDLANAGLSHGFFGFQFPIALASPADMPRVMVRLEGDDSVLLQSGSQVVAAGAPVRPPTSRTPASRLLASLRWMRARGWLRQVEFDSLNVLHRFGVYDCALPATGQSGAAEWDSGEGAGRLPEAMVVSRDLLELIFMREVRLGHERFRTVPELRARFEAGADPGSAPPVVALWASKVGHILVVEGSHHQDGEDVARHPDADPLLGGIEYTVGPDHLLFLHLGCRFGQEAPLPEGIIAISAIQSEPARGTDSGLGF